MLQMERHYIYALRYKKRWLYIGRTKNPASRESTHRTSTDGKCGSADIPKNIDWKFIIIDDTCDKTNVAYWETYYINMMEPEFNRMRPRIQRYEVDKFTGEGGESSRV